MRGGRIVLVGIAFALAGCVGHARPVSPEGTRARRLWAEAPLGPPPAATRRLTRHEYVNAVTDLLGVDLSRDPAGLPRDPAVSGFRNDATSLQASDTRIAAYERLALAVAARVPWEGAGGLARFAPCTRFDPACAGVFVDRLGGLLARRPLVADERSALVSLFDVARAAGDSFEDGARLTLRALLQSPAFLYRVEDPGSARGYAAASRLAFLIWASAPDAALLDAAGRGALDGPDSRADLVEAMLRDSRARRGLGTFAEEWLGFYRLDDIPRDGWRTSGWTPVLQQDMKEQTRRFVVRVGLEEGGDLMHLYTDTRTDLTPALAQIYGVPSQGPGFHLYDLSGDARRAGFLTHPGILGAFGSIDHASIVDRGLFVLRAVLCQDVPPPGDNLIVQFKEIPGKLTDRQRFEIHSKAPQCATCHLDFDELGYAFEPFDVLGRHQAKDGNGNALLSDGEIFLDGKFHNFAGPRAFAQVLGQSPTVQRCLVSKLYQYAIGREPVDADKPVIGWLNGAFAAGGRTYRGLVHALAAAPTFGGPGR